MRAKRSVLIGPSGSGKSTLLALMIGLEAPDRGAITDRRQSTHAPFGAPLASADGLRHPGWRPVSSSHGAPKCRAHGEGGRLAGRERRRNAAGRAIPLTCFAPPALDRYPFELSGGQRQRVSLMRALMLDPDVLLMDEPLGALDPMIRVELQDQLKAIFQSLAKTVVLVTHDLARRRSSAKQS